MQALLRLSRFIDAINSKIALIANWLVLLSCVISAGNALTRYFFNLSSNAWLEIQWYMFGALVLLGAPYTLLVNEHVRVDVLYGGLSPRRKLWIDLLGGLFFLIPMAALIGYLSWPVFLQSYEIGEVSGNAGGLLRWPIKFMLPLGFLLLLLQGISEVIKRIAALRGQYEIAYKYQKAVQ